MSALWPDARCSNRVRALLQSRAADLHHIIEPTPLSGALQLAAIEIQAIHSQTPLGEEDFTASLLGSFAATIPWFEHVFEPEFMPPLDWAKYSKGSTDPRGEGSTGADLALLIHISEQYARAAIFQAKPCEGDIVKVHRISPGRGKEGKLPQPQILRLVDHGLDVMGEKRIISDLSWIYYCGYASLSSFCIPLSSLNALIAEYRKADLQIQPQLKKSIAELTGDSGEILSSKTKEAARKLWSAFNAKAARKNEETVELVHLLADGAATPPEQEARGWLPLRGNSISEFIEKTSGVMPVFQAKASGPSPDTGLAMDVVVAEINKSFESHKARTELLSGASQCIDTPRPPRM